MANHPDLEQVHPLTKSRQDETEFERYRSIQLRLHIGIFHIIIRRPSTKYIELEIRRQVRGREMNRDRRWHSVSACSSYIIVQSPNHHGLCLPR